MLIFIHCYWTTIQTNFHIGKWIGPNYYYYQRLWYWSMASDNNTHQWPSEECRHDLLLSLKSLHHDHQWAWYLFQSWARIPPSGIFTGTITDYGHYDQCLSIDQFFDSPIQPQYCLIDLSIPLPKPMPLHNNLNHRIRPSRPSIANLIYRDRLEEISSIFYYANFQFGICLPKACSIQDIKLIASTGIDFNRIKNF